MQRWVSDRFTNEDSLDFLGVNIGEDAQYVRGYVEQMGIPIPIVLGGNALVNLYRLPGGLSPYPVDYIIDREGLVAYANHEYDPQLIVETIRRLLDAGGGEDTTSVGGNRLPPQPVSRAWLTVSPNPTNDRLEVCFSLPNDGAVRVDLWDGEGRLVESLFHGWGPIAFRQLSWTTRDCPTGVYLVSLQCGREVLTRKVAVLK